MDMLAVLEKAEAALPTLLRDMQTWHSLLVDYHPPTVERLWRQWGEHRISLHRIYPCSAEQALFHPHPWPSAVRLLDGRYVMTLGYRPYGEPGTPPVAAQMILHAPDVYEMSDPGGWHAVRPLNGPSLSVMVSGKPMYREAIAHQLNPLSSSKVDELLDRFRSFYMTPEAQATARIRLGLADD